MGTDEYKNTNCHVFVGLLLFKNNSHNTLQTELELIQLIPKTWVKCIAEAEWKAAKNLIYYKCIFKFCKAVY